MNTDGINNESLDESAPETRAEARSITPSEGAAAMLAARKIVETECRKCGKVISGTTRRRFCGAACKQSSWRRRRATASGATPSVD